MGGVILPAEHDGCKMRRPSQKALFDIVGRR